MLKSYTFIPTDTTPIKTHHHSRLDAFGRQLVLHSAQLRLQTADAHVQNVLLPVVGVDRAVGRKFFGAEVILAF